MIRGSVVIAALAALLSLLLHLMGLSLTAPRLTQQPGDTGRANSVELSNSFEDLVDTIAEPVEPEPPEAPEPVEEEPPEPAPEPAEIPTSEVHVASDDPKKTYAPDTGTAEVLQPVAPEPVEAEAPETQDTADGDKTASDDVEELRRSRKRRLPKRPKAVPRPRNRRRKPRRHLNPPRPSRSPHCRIRRKTRCRRSLRSCNRKVRRSRLTYPQPRPSQSLMLRKTARNRSRR